MLGLRRRDRAAADQGRVRGLGQRRQGGEPQGPEPRDLPQQLRRRGGRAGGGAGPDPGRAPTCSTTTPTRRRSGVFQAAKESPGRLRLRRQRRPVVAGARTGCRAARSSTCRAPFCWSPGRCKAGTFTPKVEVVRPRERRGALRAEPGARHASSRRRCKARVQGRGRLDRRRHADRRRHVRRRCRRRRPPAIGRPALTMSRPFRSPRWSATWTTISASARCPDERNAVNGLQVENRGTGRRHRGRGGRLAGHDRRRDRRAPGAAGRAAAAGAPRTVLGRQRPAHRPAVPPGRGAARARHPAVLRPHSARPPPEVGNNVVLAERLGLAVEGWFGDYKGVPIGVWGHAPARAGAARRAGGRGEPRPGHARARAPGSSPAGPSGSPGSASSPAAPGT